MVFLPGIHLPSFFSITEINSGSSDLEGTSYLPWDETLLASFHQTHCSAELYILRVPFNHSYFCVGLPRLTDAHHCLVLISNFFHRLRVLCWSDDSLNLSSSAYRINFVYIHYKSTIPKKIFHVAESQQMGTDNALFKPRSPILNSNEASILWLIQILIDWQKLPAVKLQKQKWDRRTDFPGLLVAIYCGRNYIC